MAAHLFKITVEQCYDSPDFVWSLVAYDGGVFMDGYESTEEDAWRQARLSREEYEAELATAQ